MPSPPSGFVTTVPGGALVRLHYREDVGLATLLGGGWERAELDMRRASQNPEQLRSTSGRMSVCTQRCSHRLSVLADACSRSTQSRDEPRATAREHGAERIRERRHLPCSRRRANRAGCPPLEYTRCTTHGGHLEGRSAGADIMVETRTLDDVWREAGSPPAVSYIKIDTEGTELSVLKGGRDLLATEAPSLIVEARDSRTEGWLAERGYAQVAPGDSRWATCSSSRHGQSARALRRKMRIVVASAGYAGSGVYDERGRTVTRGQRTARRTRHNRVAEDVLSACVRDFSVVCDETRRELDVRLFSYRAEGRRRLRREACPTGGSYFLVENSVRLDDEPMVAHHQRLGTHRVKAGPPDGIAAARGFGGLRFRRYPFVVSGRVGINNVQLRRLTMAHPVTREVVKKEVHRAGGAFGHSTR